MIATALYAHGFGSGVVISRFQRLNTHPRANPGRCPGLLHFAPLALRPMSLHTGSYVVFAPEERDVYSYERTTKDLAPLGAKPGSRTFAEAGNSDCAPTERRRKERTARL
ncbi:MAG: hypothetical protein QOG23_2362 [Blastocatellia bacterium]|jgi:hypothetical protein|nr:hypothetical protein [Blastocatellia bacterium]